ncbi:MAG: hypothetical protein LQ340_001051 [Diploschistes diacapsis]|nr:MAG: hypothetical protein LQ340_001051 [Diploschistes diacapsis]
MLQMVNDPVAGSKHSPSRLEISSQYATAVEYDFYVMMVLKMHWIYDQAGVDEYVLLDDRNASLSFASLIYHAWGLDCRVPHDKIYSLLSIVNGHAVMHNHRYNTADGKVNPTFTLPAAAWNILPPSKASASAPSTAQATATKVAIPNAIMTQPGGPSCPKLHTPTQQANPAAKPSSAPSMCPPRPGRSRKRGEPFRRFLTGRICAEIEKEDTLDAVQTAQLAHILATNLLASQEKAQGQEPEDAQPLRFPAPNANLDGAVLRLSPRLAIGHERSAPRRRPRRVLQPLARGSGSLSY